MKVYFFTLFQFGRSLMKLLPILLAFLLFIDIPVVSAMDKLDTAPADVQIIRAEFGLFNSSTSDGIVFVPSKTVPLVEGQGYGWRILLKTNKSKIKWREEFTLPSAPITWGDAEAQGINSVSKNRKVSVMEREDSPVEGVIFNTWTVARGDPTGHYFMRVIIDKRYERVFEFDVQEVLMPHSGKMLQ